MFSDPKDFATLIIDFSSVGATSAPGQTRSLCDVGSMSGLPESELGSCIGTAPTYRSGHRAIRRTEFMEYRAAEEITPA
jgi:hypothetical protein